MDTLCSHLGYYTSEQIHDWIFYGTAIGMLILCEIAIIFRAARENDWNFSFMLSTSFVFELLSWRKYGVFAIIHIILLVAFIILFFFVPWKNLILSCNSVTQLRFVEFS